MRSELSNNYRTITPRANMCVCMCVCVHICICISDYNLKFQNQLSMVEAVVFILQKKQKRGSEVLGHLPGATNKHQEMGFKPCPTGLAEELLALR